MAYAKIETTKIDVVENIKIVYAKRRWHFLNWWVKERCECIGKDLVIKTAEKYDRIFFNGEKLKYHTNI